MAQLAQRFRFDLADAFACDGERLADFFEGVFAAIVQAEAHLDDFFFARRQRLQHGRGLFLQVEVDDRVGRRNDGLVFDEIAEVRIFFFADRRFERNRLLRNFHNLADLGHGNVHALGNFFGGWLASEFLHKLAAGAHQFVDRLDHVDRDTNRAGLIGDGARDGLANPPCGVRGKFVAAAPLELVDGFHQADVAFLNQVEELQAAVGVFFRDGNDQAKVGFDQLFFGLLGFGFAAVDERERALEFREADFAGFFDVFQFGASRAEFLARFGRYITFGSIDAPFEAARFALERLQALDGAAHLVDQALFLEGVEIDAANLDGNLDAGAGHRPLGLHVRLFLRLGRGFQLFGLLQRQVVQLRDLVDVLQRLLGLVGDFFFGELFVVKLDDFFDGPRALAQIFADSDQFLDDDWGARD